MTDEFTGCSVCGAINEGGASIEDLIQIQIDEIKDIYFEADENDITVDITDIESNVQEIHKLQAEQDDAEFQCSECGNFARAISAGSSE